MRKQNEKYLYNKDVNKKISKPIQKTIVVISIMGFFGIIDFWCNFNYDFVANNN